MTFLTDPFSSSVRPAVRGRKGAIAAANPLAVAAGQQMLMQGGNAVDALIAAQAVLTVIAPDACGLGGDMLALVGTPDGSTHAVTGTGKAPRAMTEATGDGANSITVPGIVRGWQLMSIRWGALPLAVILSPAIVLAADGFVVSPALARAVDAQRQRLIAGGARDWALLHARPGDRFVQPALARLLRTIGANGAGAFYDGESAGAIARSVAALGGKLDEQDLADHDTPVGAPISIDFGPWSIGVQPPPTQGVLLAMALQARARFGPAAANLADHIGIELTEAAFASRADCASGAELLDRPLEIDLERAARRGGPRAYLHTAGVCASDAEGLAVSSLVSVFDDFGSGVFVPELGITLNNRAAGFTDGANAARGGKRPVHTLAPVLLRGPEGVIAMATPGADGQVQTLLQVVERLTFGGMPLEQAVAAPRWRSEGGSILIEHGHPAAGRLAALGHELRPLPAGDMRFGAVVCAGGIAAEPFALADWRRECWSGVA